ncbi:hypothetical protein [Chitinophaga pinensis]|uniref:Lipoprotein n=1 Tax=Chitinophaga pinensis TaxID=79329 RepID=A0A5C6LUN3_9BACT|nr:hypothetical protein [Chitinophaga pinensis]TWW00307.1 hypothetical protein FEF09_11525 [Chitinophaga pinensis]
MKKLAVLLFAVTAISVACKKDDKNDTNPADLGGSYTIEGKTYAADYAYWTGRDGLVITNKPQAPEYVENSVQISVDSLYFSDTYTYMVRANINYDKKKNFFGSYVRYTASGIYGEGTEITGVSAGTLNVTREKEIYTIKFNITVAGRPIQGTYVGKVEGKKFE